MIQIIEESYRKGIFGHRGYSSFNERDQDMVNLMCRGVNYFVCYKDTQADFALQYAISEWVTKSAIVSRAHKYGIYDKEQVGKFHGPHSFNDVHAYVDL
jgi:hypothetical protein